MADKRREGLCTGFTRFALVRLKPDGKKKSSSQPPEGLFPSTGFFTPHSLSGCPNPPCKVLPVLFSVMICTPGVFINRMLLLMVYDRCILSTFRRCLLLSARLFFTLVANVRWCFFFDDFESLSFQVSRKFIKCRNTETRIKYLN